MDKEIASKDEQREEKEEMAFLFFLRGRRRNKYQKRRKSRGKSLSLKVGPVCHQFSHQTKNSPIFVIKKKKYNACNQIFAQINVKSN